MNILILCTGNSCRSQMAEGYFRHFAGNRARVFSAGVETHGLNPLAVQVMAEDGIDISDHRSKPVDEFLGMDFDYVITVCDSARERCPYFPGKTRRLHRSFPDPARATGSREEILTAFRSVRDAIREFAREFMEEHLSDIRTGSR